MTLETGRAETGRAEASAPPGPPQPGEAGRDTGTGHRILEWSTHYGLIVLLAGVVAFFSLYRATGSVYLSRANLVTLIGNQAVVSIVALAALVPLAAGNIDLSAGAITGVSSLACAALMSRHHTTPLVAIALAIVAGALIGTINGVLIAVLKLSSIITTLGMSTALSGLMLWYTGGSTIGSGIPQSVLNFGSLNWLGIPKVSYVMVPAILLCWFLLENTPFGRYLQAIESNRRSARLVGISVGRTVLVAFVFSGFLAGLAGVLLTARAGAADSTTGPSFLFPALAAVFLGATTIHPGRANVWGTVVGILFVAATVSGLSLVGAATWAPSLFNGLILVAAACLAEFFARQRGGGPRMF